jgi:hypothetical protein
MPFNPTASGAEDIKDYQGKNLRRKGDTLSQNDTQRSVKKTVVLSMAGAMKMTPAFQDEYLLSSFCELL